MGPKPLTIAGLARESGVTVETIRYYQRRGLIAEPRKPAVGYRHYPTETIDRIRFIKKAQALGFTLDEIRSLLELGDGRCRETRHLAEHKLAAIRSKIRDLSAMESVLVDLIEACTANPSQKGCPLIRAMSEQD